jgi:hypothetical protein
MKTLLAVALLGLSAIGDSETSVLIARLGSPQFADREAAASALEAKGRTALRPLRTASHEAGAAAVRTGASKLVAKIEHDLLTRPTLVTLDVRDQSLGETIKSLGDRNNFGLVGDLDEVRERLLHKVTFHEEKPIPLLTALDRLSAAGGMRFGYGVDTPFAPPRFWLSNPLTFAPAGVSGPVSDSGPFRVKVLSVNYTLQRTTNLEREQDQGDGHFVDERLTLWLQVIAEPRIMLKPNGEPTIAVATDDQGESLICPPGLGEDRMPSTDNPDPIFNIQVSLKPRSRHGGTIKRLRGLIPVQIAELRPEPITVPIAGSQGKSFDGPEGTLTVKSIELSPTKEQSIEVLLRSKFEELDVEPEKPAAPGSIPPVPDSIPYLSRQIIMEDEKGQRFRGWGVSFKRLGPKEAVVSFDSSPFDEDKAVPVEFHFHGIMRTTAEISFEFSDIPLP